jgi:hypothetical protein
MYYSGASRRENAKACFIRGCRCERAKQSGSALDCFASLAMTLLL